VWFVHTKDPQEQFGDPIIYANGQQLGRALPGVAFYHDSPPGTYTFTVQSYGLTAGQALQKDVVQLAPGTQTYLEVLWGGSWLVGSAGGATFLVRTLVPSLGPAYVKMLTDGGPPPGALASPGTRSCPSGSRPRRTAPRRANLRNQAALETTDGVA
jgi:hypothetical protein